jgi:hypothetical protein
VTGRLVTVDPHQPPRLMSFLTLPCPEPPPVTPVLIDDPNEQVGGACAPSLRIRTWLGRQGELALTFQGAPLRDHAVTVGGKQVPVPAGRPTTMRFVLGAGPVGLDLANDWTDTDDAPTLTGATVEFADGSTTSLLY